jgi:thioredoxin reductase (NADPH)
MTAAYDLVVIGSGAAGLATAIAAGRRGLAAVVFEAESVGGELVNRHTIENLPGRPETSGPELRSTLVDQLGEVGGQVRLAAVDEIRREDGGPISDEAPHERSDAPGLAVDTTEGTYRARTVVVAAGGRPVRLDVPDAEAYRGRGIFYCAMCDGPLYGGEVVAVSGGDDWALTDALYLTEHADSIIVIEEEPQLSAAESLRERVVDHPDIEVRTDTEIRGVGGEDVLERLELFDRDQGVEYVESVGGLYVQHGIEPETSFLPKSVQRTDCGAVAVDQSLATAVPGLFAAGDIRQSSPRTVAAALGDGVTACRSAARYLDD